MWSNKTTVKANAASLKKFYAFMAERGLVKPEELATLKQQIKDELPYLKPGDELTLMLEARDVHAATGGSRLPSALRCSAS